MLSRSAIARVLLLIAAAALAAALMQHYWPSSGPGPDTPVAEAPTPVQPAAPAQPPISAPPPGIAPAPPPVAAGPGTEPKIESRPEPKPVPGAPEPPPIQAIAPSAPEQAEAEIDAAEARAEPKAVDLVDLNTAPVEALNRLKGGGAIGRAIVQHRPYATVDQLLSKRVLSRAVFQRIKDQVTVR